MVDQISQRRYNDGVDRTGQFIDTGSEGKDANIIFSKFLKLNPEKRERILNAAMKEFAQKGFMNASTDTIVKEAGISKGALFYYFNNKKDMFLFLYDFAIDLVKNEILLKYDREETDIFARIRQTSLLKIEILKKHPEMYDFIAAAYMEDSGEVKSDLENRNKELYATREVILNEGIDTSKLKEGVDAQRAFDIITWTMEGYANKVMAKVKTFSLYELNFNQVLQELDIYLDILKKSFYK